MPPVPLMKQPPPVYLMIPSVPRKDNPPYLHQVLESIQGFPLSHVYVFHNGKPGETHSRWEQAREMFSEAHFIRNESPLPPGHPSIFDLDRPLPPEVRDHVIKFNDTEIGIARNDTEDRKDWRRKECFDFTTMSRYMLSVINDAEKSNNTWVIFNQDDAKWRVPFSRLYSILETAKTARVDMSRFGLVSVAMRLDAFELLADFATFWCDFKPVDWMVWDFFRTNGYCERCVQAPKGLVVHIGQVSSRHGTIAGAEEADKAARAAAAKKRKEALAKNKLNEQMNLNNFPRVDVEAVRSLLHILENRPEPEPSAVRGLKGGAQELQRPKTVPKSNKV